MALSDIAAGLETTTRQREHGVATVDATGNLRDRLAAHADALPCAPAAAATVVESYAGGASVGRAGAAAGVPAMTAAKALHLLGVDGVSPLSPRQRDVVRDWLDGQVSRTDAVGLVGTGETEFALGVFVETHDPIPDLAGVVDDALASGGNAAVDKRDALGGTMSSVTDLL